MTAAKDGLRVENLLAVEALGTRLLAGSAGLNRPILWAHSCELPDPERWLGRDELLMTVGSCIPVSAADQVHLVRRLDDAGLAGIAIGDDEVAPPLTPEMLSEADVRGFPVLITSKYVPFAALGRTVAAANSESQTQQVLTLNRMYQSLLDTNGGESEEFLRSLGKVFQVAMAAVDAETAVVILPGTLRLTHEEIREILQRFPRHDDSQMARAGSIRERDISVWQIPARRRTLLFVEEGGGRLLDSFTAVHLSQTVSVEADRRATAFLAQAVMGREILASLYAGGASHERLELDADRIGLRTARLRVLVSQSSHATALTDAISLADVAHASLARGSYLTTCVAEEDLSEVLAIISRLEAPAGLSSVAHGLAEVLDAAQNAQWALDSIRPGGVSVVEYDDVAFSVLPRTSGGAQAAVKEVLGPLLDDDRSSAPLLETLCVFLDQDRNWAATASVLGIHRQSLAYRLRKIESLTGKNLRSTRDLAELWIARMSLNHIR